MKLKYKNHKGGGGGGGRVKKGGGAMEWVIKPHSAVKKGGYVLLYGRLGDVRIKALGGKCRRGWQFCRPRKRGN